MIRPTYERLELNSNNVYNDIITENRWIFQFNDKLTKKAKDKNLLKMNKGIEILDYLIDKKLKNYTVEELMDIVSHLDEMIKDYKFIYNNIVYNDKEDNKNE